MEQTTSPMPIEELQKLMTFQEAITEATIGKRIQRLAWPKDEYGYFKDDLLVLFRDGKEYNWLISKGDVIETDWVSF